MTVCVIASTISGIAMNPILAIAQDTLFELLGLFLSSRSLLLTGIKELVDLFRPKWEWARVINLESWNRLDHQIRSSFHTGPDRRVMYILIMRRGHSSVWK